MFIISFLYPSYMLIVLPLNGVAYLIVSYFRLKSTFESINRLILIDAIIFLLYLTCFIVVFLVLVDPEYVYNNLLYNFVLSVLYEFYYVLLIPLFGITLLTFYYLKLNIPIARKKVSLTLIFSALIIILFIGIYFLLEWSVPFLNEYYLSHFDWFDDAFDLCS